MASDQHSNKNYFMFNTIPGQRRILTLPKNKAQPLVSAAPASLSAISKISQVILKPKKLGLWWPHDKTPQNEWVICHPKTGINEFCHFPSMVGPGLDLTEGPAFLLFGEHWSRHSGYGYRHIIKGHWRELGYKSEPELGYESVKVVANFVALVLVSGTRILCEFDKMKGLQRPLVVNNLIGTVWLDLKFVGGGAQPQPYYSVVTAIPKKRGAGSLIGNVL